MSVILKSKDEIRVITGGLLYYMDCFRDVLTESNTFRDIKNRVGDYSEEGEFEFEEQFICWLMYRMWVANKIAYVIQYGENIIFREDLNDVEPCMVDLSFLSSELRELNYNIYTNCGRYWLDHEWHHIFELIAERIKEEAELVCVGGVR
jgi:hypothetical protein